MMLLIANQSFLSFLVDRPELESGISRFVAERLIQFGQRSKINFIKDTVFYGFINKFCSIKTQLCIKRLINVIK